MRTNQVDIIREAIYAELIQLADLYQRTDGPDCLPLMQANNLRQIFIRAADKLTETCLEATEEIYEDFTKANSFCQVSDFRPSLRMAGDLKRMLIGDTAMLEREINHYETIHESFMQQFNNHKQQNHSNSSNAGAIGGVIGAVLFGPVGAMVGGMAAGAWAGNSADQDLKAYSEKLCTHFSDTFDSVEKHLQNMGDRGLNFIISYDEKIVQVAQSRLLASEKV
jgi:hypothetical protein